MATLLSCALAALPVRALAADPSVFGDRSSDMAVDLVVVRPLSLAATAIGSVFFVVALPFTIPSGSVGDSARELVARPASYTFTRPLGDFHPCYTQGNCPTPQEGAVSK